MAKPDFISAHEWAFANQENLDKSDLCGCFYCLKIFLPSKIKDWVREKPRETALCPYCGIDSVLGSASGYLITIEFLQEMHDYWFKVH